MKNNDINIIIDQQLPPAEKSDKCTAYLAEMMKSSQPKATVKKEETKKTDLNNLKEKKLLSVTEAAELFGIGMNRIRELSNDKDCPFVIWVGSHRKIKREAFEKFLMDRQSA